MDKNRDLKRGASKFSQLINSQHNGVGNGGLVDKPKKKERVKKLSSVVYNNKASSSKQECEMMGYDLRDEEPNTQSQAQSSSKKVKFSKKFLDDCNSVDHASVPRKLRSAMKRHCESTPTFPDNSKRLNHAISRDELPKMNSVKKTKHYMKGIGADVSLKYSVLGSITKDEEEVAETLFVLAGMFLENEKNENSKQDGESLEAKVAPKDKDSPTDAFEDSTVTKEDLKSVCPTKTSDSTLPANVVNSTKEISKADPMKETVKEHPNLQCIKPPSTKNEDTDEKLLSKPMNICMLPKLTMDNGIRQPLCVGSSLLERKSEIALGARATESQHPQRLAINESWKNGLLLWPGSSSTASYPSRILNASSQVPAAKNLPWLDAALSASKLYPLETSASNGKDPKFNVAKKPLKRCAAHVYICRLIQNLQTPCKTTTALQPNQLRHNEGSKQLLTVVTDSSALRNGLPEINYGIGIRHSSSERNLNEDRNRITIQHNRLGQDQPQAAPTTGVHASHKQSFDFLSLSASGGMGISLGSYTRPGNAPEPPRSEFQVPYIQSLVQHQTHMSQTRYNSSAYSDQLAAAAAAQQVQLQLPHISSSISGMNSRASIHTSNSNDKQQFWAAYMGTQQRSTAMGMTQFPSWQNGFTSQSTVPSLDLLCPKYPQQLSTPITTSSSKVKKRNDHPLLSICEETGVGFRNGSALSLQLLCNDRLYSTLS